MANFNSTAPDWDQMTPLLVSGDVKRTSANTVSVETSEGPLVITLHHFGARLRFGECQFGQYGMLIEEPVGVALSLDSVDGKSVIKGGAYTLTLRHDPFAFELSTAARTELK